VFAAASPSCGGQTKRKLAPLVPTQWTRRVFKIFGDLCGGFFQSRLPLQTISYSTRAASPHLSDSRSVDGSASPICAKGVAIKRVLSSLSRATDSDLRASSETPISFTLMVHHIVLYKLKPEVTPARVEAMMMNTRMQLLKIPEVLNIKCGKRIDPELPWPFFIAIDFESMDKYAIFREDPIFVKFMEEVIKPNTEDSLDLDFEMDPGKDVRFS
jgi:hypothetical protein